MQVFTVVNDNMAHIITFSSTITQFIKYLPDAQKMIARYRLMSRQSHSGRTGKPIAKLTIGLKGSMSTRCMFMQ